MNEQLFSSELIDLIKPTDFVTQVKQKTLLICSECDNIVDHKLAEVSLHAKFSQMNLALCVGYLNCKD